MSEKRKAFFSGNVVPPTEEEQERGRAMAAMTQRGLPNWVGVSDFLPVSNAPEWVSRLTFHISTPIVVSDEDVMFVQTLRSARDAAIAEAVAEMRKAADDLEAFLPRVDA